MRYSLALCAALLVSALHAEDKWTFVRSGPFEVWTNGPEKQAKLRLLEAEQFRHALTNILGKQELKSTWPIRILAVKDKRATLKPLAMIRDGYIAVIPNEQQLGPDFRRAAARLFLDANTKRYPDRIDQGLEEILSALDVQGTHISLGAPPPDKLTPGWARVHLMVTDPAFSGTMRVYLSNLEQGGDEGTACRNSFQKSLAEVDKLVQEHAAKTSFEWKTLTSRSISIDRDYYAKTLPSEQARIAEVDAGMAKAVSLADLQTPESFETQELYEKAANAGSKSARAWLQYALLVRDKDKEQARAALKKAAELNPQWGAPHAELARLETIPVRIMMAWKTAANLEVRNLPYWQAYALTATAAKQFPEAAKAWTGAERAAGNEAERAQLKQARMDLETQRADFAEAERRKLVEDRERELARLKAEALGEIRKAEMKANDRMGAAEGPARDKVEKWWDGPKGEQIAAMLARVDCLNGPARLVLTVDGKPKQLLVREPSKIVIMNGENQTTLGCGVQKPPRKVAIEFQPKPDAKFATAGDVLRVDFK